MPDPVHHSEALHQIVLYTSERKPFLEGEMIETQILEKIDDSEFAKPQ